MFHYQQCISSWSKLLTLSLAPGTRWFDTCLDLNSIPSTGPGYSMCHTCQFWLGYKSCCIQYLKTCILTFGCVVTLTYILHHPKRVADKLYNATMSLNLWKETHLLFCSRTHLQVFIQAGTIHCPYAVGMLHILCIHSFYHCAKWSCWWRATHLPLD